MLSETVRPCFPAHLAVAPPVAEQLGRHTPRARVTAQAGVVALLQPIRGEDGGHVTSCGPITAHLLLARALGLVTAILAILLAVTPELGRDTLVASITFI